ncbi:host nuclease inhibitor protein [Serratia quinivorans]|uniref:host nuclease inhibitor protein n=1 Tax=Serratia quinivorans TaxID=137545 RepID=UPI0039822EC1
MKLIAYAWASGLIEFGKTIPEGALPILVGQETEVKETIGILARHSYTNSQLLVPGVPEAYDQHSAMDALIYFSNVAKRNYADLIKGESHE